MSRLAVIGGSGFAAMPGLQVLDHQQPDTPYGPASAPVTRGLLGGAELFFLPRHGTGHSIPPHRIHYRANLWALKACGAERVVGLAAVGGIGGAFGPRVLAVPDQIIDYTYGRAHSFSDGDQGEVLHIDFTRPYCEDLRQALLRAARDSDLEVEDGGTYGATQGPRLETAAEIMRLERDGCDLVGMTGMPEAALARELGLCYACFAFVVNWAAGKASGEIRMEEIETNVAACSARIERILTALAGAD
ncbi:S-methyl-5'-thioinosine phosphorylase [Candidatus Thiosymbion oneisti]|uniref:S-methyl-5'-thioinosine phosphorylase n=1 Tax=Candidatus Thiosymbion oneisti TaxID=589554 RepID=UPI000B0783B9|nr:S-methyl-5'-thioinosine phosphorylase [Candidatus Thiosymbion oneisti]